MYSTVQNPHGCCDGYMWDSAVGNCVGMVSTLNILFYCYKWLWNVLVVIYIVTNDENMGYWTNHWKVFFQNAVWDIAGLDVSLFVLIHCMEKIAKTYAIVLLRSTVISCLDALRVSTCNKTIHVTYINH